ncbi:protein spartin [Anabrus simplex]|uniref:protein spartin n=1 Tax=Anabrus simplex TaxID=316456 RepID=UPI0034DD591B
MDCSGRGSWPEVFEELKKYHDQAFLILENGIKLEQEGKFNEALLQYDAGLVALDRALSIPIECPSNPDITWEKAGAMVQKMKKTRKEVLSRICDAQTNQNFAVVPPPTYEEATSGSHTSISPSSLQTYSDLGAALQNLKINTGAQSATILFAHDNVRVYFISPDGNVLSTSEPDTLYIVQLEDEGEGDKPRAYLQVGNWIYPLVPGVSPCFRSQYGAFILPDVHSTVEGSAVGIILPPEPDASVYDLLDDILHGVVQRVPEPEGRAGRRRRDVESGSAFAQGLVKGAQYISSGLVRGAEKAGQYMNIGTPKLISKITPESTPANINPNVQRGLRIAKDVTGTAVQITGFVASRIGCATVALGRYLAPHIQKQGTRLLTKTWNMSEPEASKKVGSVLEVAAGAAESFGTIYEGLERSAGILASSLANNTVKVVEHKYGIQAGAATGDTFQAVGNVLVAGHTVKFLTTPKGLIKKTATGAGRGILENYKASQQGENPHLHGLGNSNVFYQSGNFGVSIHPGSSGSGSSTKPGPSSEVD